MKKTRIHFSPKNAACSPRQFVVGPPFLVFAWEPSYLQRRLDARSFLDMEQKSASAL